MKTFLTTVVALGFAALATRAAEPRPPNIVFILADDMGWNQVGYHGSTYYETPNIDRLAKRGVRFSDFYAAAPICSATRSALMSGKYPARTHITDFIPGQLFPDKPLVTPRMQQGLPLAERTLAERLKERGYRTGLFGKWHLAPDYNYQPNRPMDPESQGFDVVRHTRKPEQKDIDAVKKDAHNAIEITDHAIEFIHANRGQPFFCYVAHNVVHRPIGEQPEFVAKYKKKPGADQPENNAVMGAMIERMDQNIGRLLDALDREGLAANTVVVFTSDNGGVVEDGRQTPFRGGKSMLWEGGLRVPMTIYWPGVTRAGGTSHEPAIMQDFFYTLLDAAGAKIEPGLADGVSLAAHLRTGAPLGREAIFFHYPHYHALGGTPSSAIRAGRYKLIEWHEGALLGAGPTVQLFDLEQDQGETRDLAAEKPELAAQLREKLRAWRRSVDAQEMTVREKSGPASDSPKEKKKNRPKADAPR